MTENPTALVPGRIAKKNHSGKRMKGQPGPKTVGAGTPGTGIRNILPTVSVRQGPALAKAGKKDRSEMMMKDL
jgi:hypothetical protein